MSRKQNSLMRFSRTERLAQLSEQEIVIERKKKEIQARLEAQKKKETEEALRKLESAKESKTNKSGLSKASFGGSLRKKSSREKSVEKSTENLTNVFSNDGSFLDQFKKLSQTDLDCNNINLQSAERKKDSDDIHSNQKKVDDYKKGKDCKSISNTSCASKSFSSKSQLKIPPPGVVQLVPQSAGVKVIQKSQNQGPLEHSVSSFHSNNLQTNYPGVTHSVSESPKMDCVFDSKPELRDNSFSSIQLPFTAPPQSFQNIPHRGSHSELPKFRSDTVSMTLKPNTVKKLEAIPNPLDGDQTPPSSPNKNELIFSEKKESLTPSFLGGSHNFSFTSSLENVSSHNRDSSRISSAFHDNDEDEENGDYQVKDKYHKWAELVSRFGDEYENSLISRSENEPELRFLLDKNSDEYFSFRKLVTMYRKGLKSSESGVSESILPNTSKVQFDEFSKTGISDKNYSDTSRLSPPKRMAPVDQRESMTNFKNFPDEKVLVNEESDYTSKEECFSLNQKQSLLKGNSEQIQSEERRKRKRKSRWGEAVPSTSTSGIETTLQPIGKLPAPKSNLLSQLTRSDPGLIQYARQTFGSTNLSEEDWKKAEDHYKINLLYQDMVKKRAEVEKLEKQGKFKYEYDSDEDTEGGTWEHKLRQQEMQATQLWAEELTRQAAGKHHIGDFLPPEELEKFMEKYNAVKEGREPDLSDYKEYKLKQDNIGYRLLQKMGWNEGQGLGQDGSGITNPVNKGKTRHENQGLGVERADGLEPGDDEYDAYRKRMMLAYRFRPNPLNNPRRPYY